MIFMFNILFFIILYTYIIIFLNNYLKINENNNQ